MGAAERASRWIDSSIVSALWQGVYEDEFEFLDIFFFILNWSRTPCLGKVLVLILASCFELIENYIERGDGVGVRNNYKKDTVR